MTAIDQRILRVGVEVSGALRMYEGLGITASGTKMANDNQNTADVTIYNMAAEARNFILTETSPFNKNRTPKKLVIEAGRVSSGVSRVFVGEIISSSISQPPDIGLQLKAKTGEFQKGNLVARSAAAKDKLSAIAKRVSDDIGTSLEFEATDKLIANYSFSGAALRQINALAEAGMVDVFQDDETLVVKDAGKPRRNLVKIISAQTGMIGIPEVTERGVRVKVLFDQETQLGGAAQIRSELNPAVNGSYTIYKMDYDLASRENQWYYTIEATRNE